MNTDVRQRTFNSLTRMLSVYFSSMMALVVLAGCELEPAVFEAILIDSPGFVPVSISEDGDLLKNSAWIGRQAVSADGRYITFEAQNQVYLMDTATGISKIISQSDNNLPGNGYSFGASIDYSGGSVVFLSWATNLAGGDGQLGPRVYPPLAYRYDVADDKLENLGFAPDSVFRLSGDGQVFCALLNGLPGCTDFLGLWSWDLFRWVASNDYEYWYSAPVPNADGSVVALTTDRPLTSDDVDDRMDIYLLDTKPAGGIKRISVGQDNVFCDSYRPAISADGNFVVFLSCLALEDPRLSETIQTYYIYDNNLDTIKAFPSQDSEFPGWQWYINGEPSDTTMIVSDGWAPSVSNDGRFVALKWLLNGKSNVVVWDTQTGFVEPVVPDELLDLENEPWWRPSIPRITPDGSKILFGACLDGWENNGSLYITENPLL